MAILGSGMAGLGAAWRLRAEGLPSVLYDQHSHPGGHTASHRTDGFVFDEGPHVSFTRDETVRRLFAESVGGRYESVDAQINNYWRGHWIRHPAITNLHGLPPGLVVDVVRDFVEREAQAPARIRTYEDWLVASYGRTFAQTFPMQYTRKYHTTDAANLSTEWVGPRLYQARLEEVLRGAVSPDTPNIHYVQDYRYPTEDGFQAFLRGLTAESTLALGHRAVEVDPRAREVRFANGAVARYDHLISSVALPDLVPMIAGVPADVLEAAGRLACTTLVLVNLGVARPDVSDASWNYYYDDEFPFSRVSYPRTFSRRAVPEGMSAIQAEVYFSRKYRPLEGPPEAWIEPTIAGLTRCGVLRPDDRIVLRQAMLIPWANIIFDLEREDALRTVHGFLAEAGIAWCGRYGEWGYLWSDEAFRSGERAASGILDHAGRGRRAS
ncbi:MAG TPA: NAD(P)-binding protein [Gemmatimonadales bacterium]|nr:NAD(P)-binding protein [Gemmatimonadales bacterium]